MPDLLRLIVPAEGRAGTIDRLTDYLCPIKVSCRVPCGLYGYGLYSYGTCAAMAYIGTACIAMACTVMALSMVSNMTPKCVRY